jgi:hypothetical protein
MGGNDPRFLAWLMPRVLLGLAWRVPLAYARRAWRAFTRLFKRGKK